MTHLHPSLASNACRAILALFATLAVCGGSAIPAAAQTSPRPDSTAVRKPIRSAATTSDSSIYQDQGRLIRAPEAIASLSADLFGDKVNLYSGGLEFVQNDLSLPGNNALPISVGRRLVVGVEPWRPLGQFGTWDLEIPHLHGIYSVSAGWSNAFTAGRCSQMSAPAVVRGVRGGATFTADEYWHGHFLYVPGQGDQELLARSSTYANFPSDGLSYPVVTTGLWSMRCLPGLANAATNTAASGEGFLAIAPDGTQYRFDWLATRPVQNIEKPTSLGDFDFLGRNEIWIMPTLVTDRFGNTVTYTYDPLHPMRVTSIASSDGRTITFTYGGLYDNVTAVSDGTRTWTYTYDTAGNLSTVRRPDASTWQLAGAASLLQKLYYLVDPDCDTSGNLDLVPLTASMIHPSGAVGTFTLVPTMHGRSQVNRVCRGGPTTPTYAMFPKFFATHSLTSKTITGPGLPSLTWSHAYGAPNASWSPCSGCAETKTVSVTNPQGWVTRYTFGNRYLVNEGKLVIQEDGFGAGGAVRTATTSYRSFGTIGSSGQPRGDSGLNSTLMAVEQKLVTQQGTNFTWQANSFDGLARPLLVTRASGLGYSRADTTAYFDQRTKWVLGHVASVTESSTGLTSESNTYDAATANRLASYRFGLLQETYSYNADGTLLARYDPLSRATVYTNYKRGLAQNVSYPDSTAESAVVNNLGLITAHTNPAGTTTGYGYDAMGRLASITPPGGDAVAYFSTTLLFEQVASAELGIAAGHWRQTVATGNARTVRYFDGLWRERLSYTYDLANPAATGKALETRYDADGRTVFTGYAQRNLTPVDSALPGTSSSYDALGRNTQVRQDSELGVLTTNTAYLAGFQRQMTNPRNFITTTSFHAWDSPSEDLVAGIAAPEGVSVGIARDVFGKPRAITRSGGGASATRSYVYDANQRLCKTIEPESGATVLAYDNVNNLAWRASGLALPGTSSCDQASVPAARMLSHGYDARRRLTATSYGDSSPGIGRSYTADGLPYQVWSAGSTWTYGYNNRRLQTSESLAYAGATYALTRGIDAYGNVASLAYPGGPTLAYSPDALGRPTQVSGHASGVAYHPNGAIAGYTLANGIAHSSTQTTRGLPLVWRDAGVVQDLYAFDANGNVTSITDQQEGLSSRSMTLYDGLDRLRAVSGIWGAGSFTYDALDNLRTSTLGARSLSHNIDAATNRLASLSGSLSIGFGYDANGNVTARGTQAFGFDIGNRLGSAPGKASYAYDGHGRRTAVAYADGSSKVQVYGSNGKLLYTKHSTQGDTRHIYLGERLIAETNSLSGTSYSHTDALGSPVAKTSAAGALLSRTRYEPYGATAAGTNPTGIGFTGHVNDADTGLVYMQQRYQDPLAGRFLSVDQVTTDANTGGSFNRYVYGNNNPYKFKDPDGREPMFNRPQEGGGGGDGLGFADVIGGKAAAQIAAAAEHIGAPMMASGVGLFKAAGNATQKGRVFTSADPLVGKLATKIDAAYPGHVVGVNVPIRDAAGRLVTDADILLRNGVVQVKSGGGKGLTSQLERTEQATGLPAIGYGPDLKPSILRGCAATNCERTLIEVVKP